MLSINELINNILTNVCQYVVQAICLSNFEQFIAIDSDNNGFIDVDEQAWRVENAKQPYDMDSHICRLQTIRNELAIGYQEDYQEIDVSTLETHVERLSAMTKYSTCTDCTFVQEMFTIRKEIHDARQNIDKSDKCWMLTEYSGGQ